MGDKRRSSSAATRDVPAEPNERGPLTFGRLRQRCLRLTDLRLLLLFALLVGQVRVGVVVAQAGTVLVAFAAD